MLSNIARRYFWPNITTDIRKYIESCEVCQANKRRRERELGTLSVTGPATTPMQIISIDTIGGFEGYNSECKHLHYAIDHFSRFAWTLASRNQKTRDYINLLNKILEFATPNLILTDRYPGIRSRGFETYINEHNIGIKYIATQCPHSNGIAERLNQTLVNKLRCMHAESPDTPWDRLLRDATNIYNDTIHTSTRFSPRFLLLGITVHNETNITESRVKALENSRIDHDRNKQAYNARHQAYRFEIGDQVWIKNHYRKKLDPIYEGPYTILDRISDNSYIINKPSRGRTRDIFHVSHLRPVN